MMMLLPSFAESVFILSFKFFQSALEKSEFGARPSVCMGLMSFFMRSGTWSLPIFGHLDIIDVMSMVDVVKVRSIID